VSLELPESVGGNVALTYELEGACGADAFRYTAGRLLVCC
jgi:hypothetical protein